MIALKLVLGVGRLTFKEQAILCVPRDGHGQDVNSPAYNDYVAQKVIEIVDLTRGRAFILFTNRKSMVKVAESVRDGIEEKGYPFLMQGEAPREALLGDFRAKGNAVLFGLDSFWEGVDVPGDALSCVVLARPSLPRPGDPVL